MPTTYPPRRPKKPHHIADISYRKDFILCACSWRGKVDEYDAHRRAGNRVVVS